MKTLLFLLLAILLTGCASNPKGSSWLVADFNKYGKNYAPFPTNQLDIGMTKSDLLSVLGADYEIVEAGQEYEILAYQQWASVTGPDYVKKTLYLKVVNNHPWCLRVA